MKAKFTINNAAPRPKVGTHEKEGPRNPSIATIDMSPRIVPANKLAKERTVGFPNQITSSKSLTP